MADHTTIVIIGAGVIGLTTGLRLLATTDQAKYRIIIVSREWPTSIPGAPVNHSVNYASMWAGAHMRPIPASTPQLQREAAWLKHAARTFEEQIRQTPSIGVTKCKGIELLEAPTAGYEQQTAESFFSESGLNNYRKYSQAELPPGVRLGFEYDTYCVNAPVYCANLLRSFILQGGRCMQRDLSSEWEASSIAPNVSLVVNASGMGFGDKKCFPIRGQTVLTDLSAVTKTVTKQKRDGTWSFIIPRFFEGGTVVGGTKQPGDWTAQPILSTRSSVLSEGRKIAEFASDSSAGSNDVRVIADIVGRRPMREGGMRVEVEHPYGTSVKGQSSMTRIVHAYGAGGRGFEISWGVAEEVASLVKATLLIKDSIIQAKL
ncbi:nucleotide-binding domain-containing protein [Aaosphaeria arxii CBS 175.79]|uniref:Nucleotide-binding domain-containing protein n=1 Tax=Aaosphaeria arxii CBS 175.79 TaxID=1450172 RepID=A0A6A5XQT5_9PLEO|nr:nucleotide-binding domain-containing protein [Aaosphaeria arxii CBS 175.79]KAF2015197.1 nucleotide-binding domain-containing protein [Aaosphaeria arxii CBS 175.79]